MPDPLCLIGGGQHARVVAEAAGLAGLAVAGCWAPTAVTGLRHLGDDARLARERGQWAGHGFHLALAGGPRDGLRRRLAEQYGATGLRWCSVIHPTAWVSPSARLGAGVFIGPRALVHAGAELGDHVLVNSGALVEHDCVLDTGVNLAPGVVCGGGVEIGAWTMCGLGAVLRDHCRIGAGALVAMGAVVVDDIPLGTEVRGVPARPVAADP